MELVFVNYFEKMEWFVEMVHLFDEVVCMIRYLVVQKRWDDSVTSWVVPCYA